MKHNRQLYDTNLQKLQAKIKHLEQVAKNYDQDTAKWRLQFELDNAKHAIKAADVIWKEKYRFLRDMKISFANGEAEKRCLELQTQLDCEQAERVSY